MPVSRLKRGFSRQCTADYRRTTSWSEDRQSDCLQAVLAVFREE